jgi:hypothetical protein
LAEVDKGLQLHKLKLQVHLAQEAVEAVVLK